MFCWLKRRCPGLACPWEQLVTGVNPACVRAWGPGSHPEKACSWQPCRQGREPCLAGRQPTSPPSSSSGLTCRPGKMRLENGPESSSTDEICQGVTAISNVQKCKLLSRGRSYLGHVRQEDREGESVEGGLPSLSPPVLPRDQALSTGTVAGPFLSEEQCPSAAQKGRAHGGLLRTCAWAHCR